MRARRTAGALLAVAGRRAKAGHAAPALCYNLAMSFALNPATQSVQPANRPLELLVVVVSALVAVVTVRIAP